MARSCSLHLEENYILVAAIDLGTTFSGYAFSFKEKPDAINMNKNWGSTRGSDSYKTPTCVMTKPDGSLHSFGYEAEDDYFQLDPDCKVGGPDGFNLYRNFKMVLHGKDINMNSTIASISGHVTKAIDIFSKVLEFLKNHMMEPINKAVREPLKDVDIRWVITVPAIWTDEAKGFMRQAAFKGGLIPDPESNTLLIALEPEAASVFCRSIEISTFSTSDTSSENVSFGEGDKMMIIDAGGGTVDITAHVLEQSRKVKEITKPSGGPWGGIKVDEKFVELLAEVLGTDFLKHIKNKSPQQWLQFMTTFERSKKSVKPDGKTAIKVSLPYVFNKEYNDITGSDIESTIKNHPLKLVSFANGFIVIRPDMVKHLFQNTCTMITSHIGELLKNDPRLESLQYMLLVGGYGESAFLKEACDRAFGERCKVLVPYDAQLAIVKGAVLFGHKPLEISSRISRLTYGCQADLVFQEGIHEESRAYKSRRDGQKRCRNTFREFVHIGEQIENPDIRSFTVHPPTKKEKKIVITLYKSENANVVYCDETGVAEVAKFMLSSPKGYLSEDIELRVTFGHTEILVEARDPKGGKEFTVRTKIRFSAEL